MVYRLIDLTLPVSDSNLIPRLPHSRMEICREHDIIRKGLAFSEKQCFARCSTSCTFDTWCAPHWLDTCTVICFIFIVKKKFLQRKHTKIFYANIILQREFFHVGWLPTTHKHFSNCCCPCILVYVVASNTTNHLLFTIASLSHVVHSINAHHIQLVNSIWSVRKSFYANIFWKKIY